MGKLFFRIAHRQIRSLCTWQLAYQMGPSLTPPLASDSRDTAAATSTTKFRVKGPVRVGLSIPLHPLPFLTNCPNTPHGFLPRDCQVAHHQHDCCPAARPKIGRASCRERV